MLSTARSVLKKIFEQPPPGYRQGATLDRVMADVRGKLTVTSLGAAHAHLSSADGSLKCKIRERVERHFLMHIVALEVSLTVPAAAVPGGRLEIRNSGVMFRKGIVCAVPTNCLAEMKAIKDMLEGNKALVAALMVLDFRRCELVGTETGWQICLEPYGASEVVSRMPSFRRYIRLGREQTDSLIMALKALQHVLQGPLPA